MVLLHPSLFPFPLFVITIFFSASHAFLLQRPSSFRLPRSVCPAEPSHSFHTGCALPLSLSAASASSASAASTAGDNNFTWSFSDLPAYEGSIIRSAASAAAKHRAKNLICFIRCDAWNIQQDRREQERLLLKIKRGPLSNPFGLPVPQDQCLQPTYLGPPEEGPKAPETLGAPSTGAPERALGTPPDGAPEGAIGAPPDGAFEGAIGAPPDGALKEVSGAPPDKSPGGVSFGASPDGFLKGPSGAPLGGAPDKRKEYLKSYEWEALLLGSGFSPSHLDSLAHGICEVRKLKCRMYTREYVISLVYIFSKN